MTKYIISRTNDLRQRVTHDPVVPLDVVRFAVVVDTHDVGGQEGVVL